MWSRGGPRSSALDRAKAQLSGQRFTSTGTSKDKTDVGNLEKFVPQPKQPQFLDLSDVSSASQSDNRDDPFNAAERERFSMGGGSRFLKKTSKDVPLSRTQTKVDEFKLIPQRSSQSVALSRLALIENRIRNQKGKGVDPSNEKDLSAPQETLQSSSDLSMTGSRFLKKTTVSTPQEQKVSERTSVDPHATVPGLNERSGRRLSLDSDEQDMQILLGDSFSLSEGSLLNITRQKSSQPVNKSYMKSNEKFTVPSPTTERQKQKHQALSNESVSSSPSTSPKPPSPSRPDSRRVRFTERFSVSPESAHSEIRSLDDLFSVASVPDADDTLSESSLASDDFKLNVMTLDDLVPVPSKGAKITQEKIRTETKKDVRERKLSNDRSNTNSPPAPEEPSAAYESDFESEIPSEAAPTASEISEHLTDQDKDASLVSEAQYSSYRSENDDEDNDDTLSESSQSYSHHRDSYSDDSSRSRSSNTTITHGQSPDRHVKEAAVQTQAEGLTFTWSSGLAAMSPSVGMTYVDPTPIASHTVSAEAIESLTSYSPAVLALNDMLRQQLSITRSFIESTRRHYAFVLESLGPADYKYTTLEDTKEFIRAHQPPKLSIDDALEEVLQEMSDHHYL